MIEVTWEDVKEFVRNMDKGGTRFRIDGSDTMIIMYNESGTVLFGRDNSVYFENLMMQTKIMKHVPFGIMNTLINIFYICENEEAE